MSKPKLTASEKNKLWLEQKAKAQMEFFKKNFGIEFSEMYSKQYLYVKSIQNEDWLFFCSQNCLKFEEKGIYSFEPKNWKLKEKIFVKVNEFEPITIAIGNVVNDGALVKVNPENLTDELKNHLQDIVIGDDDFTKLKNCRNEEDEYSKLKIKIKGRYL